MPKACPPRRAALPLAAASLSLLAGAAAAQPVVIGSATFENQGLVGVGRAPATARDLFGDTLSFGSGLVMDLSTWRRNGDSYSGVLFGLPDRGWNTQGSVDYQARLQRFAITLSPYSGAAILPAGPGQQSQLGLNLTQTLGLSDGNGTPTTGLDASGTRPAGGGFPVLPIGANGRVALDTEGVVRSRDGSFWISDEYGPGIYRFSADGRMLGAIRAPDALIPIRNGVEQYSSNNPPAGQPGPTPANPVTGRQNNQGYEGLAISPDGRTLTALLQSATRQDGGSAAGTRYYTRMLTYDISNPDAPRLSGEYVVRLPQYVNAAGQTLVAAQSELLQLNRTQYLMLSRDSAAGFTYADAASAYRAISVVDVSGATNIAGSAYDGTTPVAPAGVLVGSVTPAAVSAFLNMNDNGQLARFGLHNGLPNTPNNLYEKWEGMALVPVLDRNRPHDFFLLVSSDNDFITTNGSMQGTPYAEANDVDNVVLVYRVALPTYIDPLALQSLEVTALPLARATGESALQVARTVLGQADARVFNLRTLTGREDAATAPRFNAYVTGAFNFTRTDGSGSAGYAYGPGGSTGRAAADPDVRAVTAGGDYRVTPNLRLGLSLSYYDTSTSLSGSSRIDGTGGAVSPYATMTFGASWLDLQYSYLFGDWDIRRDTQIYGLTGRGKPSGSGHLIQLSAGHNFTSGPVVFGPTGRLSYSHLTINGYTESEAIHAAARVPRQDFEQAVLNLGGQVSWPLRFDWAQVVPQLRAGYDIALTDDKRDIAISLATVARPEAQVTGPVGTLNQSGFRGGAGVVFRRENFSLLLDYDIRTRREGTLDHLFTISLGMAF
ncbi:esterase-like activity of phytase family protein [Siccirubricoccus sp. KC 17139]|uniref:Esterase-like activity of phytase family protein n=1 Tax=Siccirubricoccus soli TaxID=2899147 RepID=A0ABT1CYI9_9PROT|nr:esterase-like activity of phytase family protein [Siccirubricoccus soli]MCO6414731.1 esterase-like activity of phytase family protein [Siccirubricoccus soli]MCP2680861.1 esterase-like activity of phytase family protein [Siccirubricoccus soli]